MSSMIQRVQKKMEEEKSSSFVRNIKLFPVAKQFIYNHSYLSAIMGPVGSGKSVACILKILFLAMCIQKGHKGIRYSRWLVVRNTKKELKDTTIRTFKQWLGAYGVYKETDMNFHMKVNDIDCEVQFIALDDEKDTKKLLSLECTGIYFNELREINDDVWETAQQRIGRFPSLEGNGSKAVFDKEMAKAMGFELDYSNEDEINMECMWADTNPPMIGSYFHKIFEKQHFDPETGEDKNPRDFKLFRQPSGMSADAENKPFLPNNYYENIVANSTQEKVDVMVHAKYGISETGLGVYRSYFKYGQHTDNKIFEKMYNTIGKNYKLAIGMDFGLNPAVVIGQYLNGKLYIYEEVITLNNSKRGLDEMLQRELLPLLARKYIHHKLNHNDIVILGDPAGNQRSAISGRTSFQELKKYGFKVRVDTLDNKISPRIEAVKHMLKPTQLGVFQFSIDEKCKYAIDGFQGNYYYEKDKLGFKDVPVKNEYSHVHDAIQYLCKQIFTFKDKNLGVITYKNFNDQYKPSDPLAGS